ncbi:unnamed protein product [Closterium sp. NIES-53]
MGLISHSQTVSRLPPSGYNSRQASAKRQKIPSRQQSAESEQSLLASEAPVKGNVGVSFGRQEQSNDGELDQYCQQRQQPQQQPQPQPQQQQQQPFRPLSSGHSRPASSLTQQRHGAAELAVSVSPCHANTATATNFVSFGGSGSSSGAAFGDTPLRTDSNGATDSNSPSRLATAQHSSRCSPPLLAPADILLSSPSLQSLAPGPSFSAFPNPLSLSPRQIVDSAQPSIRKPSRSPTRQVPSSFSPSPRASPRATVCATPRATPPRTPLAIPVGRAPGSNDDFLANSSCAVAGLNPRLLLSRGAGSQLLHPSSSISRIWTQPRAELSLLTSRSGDAVSGRSGGTSGAHRELRCGNEGGCGEVEGCGEAHGCGGRAGSTGEGSARGSGEWGGDIWRKKRDFNAEMRGLRVGRAKTERGGHGEGGIRSQGGVGAGGCERNERGGGSSQGVVEASARPRARVSPACVSATCGSAMQVSTMFWEALLRGGGTGEGAGGMGGSCRTHKGEGAEVEALGEGALQEVERRHRGNGGTECEGEECEERVCEKRVCRGGKAERFEQDSVKEAWMEIGGVGGRVFWGAGGGGGGVGVDANVRSCTHRWGRRFQAKSSTRGGAGGATGTGDIVRGRQRTADASSAPGVACTRKNGGAGAAAAAAAARAVAFEAPRTAAAVLEESPEAVESGCGAGSVGEGCEGGGGVAGDGVGTGGSSGSARVSLSEVADVFFF